MGNYTQAKMPKTSVIKIRTKIYLEIFEGLLNEMVYLVLLKVDDLLK
jgi:hypothetical protein